MRSPTRLAVLLLSAGILAAGCAQRPAAADCPDPLGCLELAPSAPLVIGLVLTTSGEQAVPGLALLQSLEAALDAQGELLGHPLVFARQDTDCSTGTAREAATRLALEDDLVAVLGPSCPTDREVLAPILDQAGLCLVEPGASGSTGLTRLFLAIEEVATARTDGSLSIPRQALAGVLQGTP